MSASTPDSSLNPSSATLAQPNAQPIAEPAEARAAKRFQPNFSALRIKSVQKLRNGWGKVQTLPEDAEPRRQWLADYQRALEWVKARVARVPELKFDDALPITAYVDPLIAAIKRHQVVVVAGATGSGKSTQLAKLCLAAGRGTRGLIACTQPRRIAAKTVAKRVAEELDCQIGSVVGWQVRFTEAFGEATLIKFMTDGILLAETQTDRFLSNYDTIIIDEAHERSLNIDFLLGFLKQLLPKRPDLKLIITSATIDTERFARHFNDAPVFQVEGRGFPVEIRYRPILGDDEAKQELNLTSAVIAAVEELSRESPMADVLIFFPGEREIRECQTALQRRNFRETEVLPLYARLGTGEQDRVFKPEAKRRIVLASNVAETSITVPRIRYVIDTGTARISRYSPRSKIERLHIEAISQASANQRAGRCGRISAGVCIRLYEESDFQLRPAFTDPEILRSSLAGVLLRMLKLRLGDPRAFPFVDPPDERAINDGYLVLQELGAINAQRQLSDIGQQMANLPIDVHYARMLVQAARENSLREALILASGLSIQDPRERPADQRGSADAAHAEFADERSDFLSLIRLWEAYQHQSAALSQSQLRDWCRRRFLSFLRLREWRDLHAQLSEWAGEAKWSINTQPATADTVHKTLLAALIAQVGEHEEKGTYLSTRGRKFQIFPGSAIKGTPRWVMVDTLLDTQKVWAIGVAKIEPAWVESLGAHLIKKRYYDPFWDARAGRVMCFEDQSLLGLLIVQKRRAQFEPIDAEETRRLFLLHVFGLHEIQAEHRLFAHNAAVRQEAERKEEKLRTRGLLRTASELAQLFESRIPEHVRSVPALMTYLRTPEGRANEPNLRLQVMDFLLQEHAKERGFPDELRFGAGVYPLQYQFDPKSELDGVSLQVKLEQLGALPAKALDWLVPGLRDEKAQALIKSLPKVLRRMAVPAPDFSKAFLESYDPHSAGFELSMSEALAEFLSKICGAKFAAADFDSSALPAHLQFRVEILGPAGEVLEHGRDLPQLQSQFKSAARKAFTTRMGELYNRDGLKIWPFDLPEHVRGDDGSLAYPALLFLDGDVKLRAYATQEEAQLRHPLGVLQLLRLHLPDEQRYWRKHISLSAAATLAYAATDTSDKLRIEIVEASLRDLALSIPAKAASPDPSAVQTRSNADFHRLAEWARNGLGGQCAARGKLLDEVLTQMGQLKRKLTPPIVGYGKANFDDLRAQIQALIYPGFVLEVDLARLQHYPRYFKAMQLRVERLLNDAVKDQQKLLDVLPFVQKLQSTQAARAEPAWQALRWALEELRVSIFAPELRTAEPVSVKRLSGLAERI